MLSPSFIPGFLHCASLTFDDLTSAGTIGLIEAVERFDPSRGLKLRSYAQHRIWAAMLDFLRNEHPLSRTTARTLRAHKPSVSTRFSHQPWNDSSEPPTTSSTTWRFA